MDENTIWDVRAFIYRYFAESARPPRLEEIALHFGISREEVRSIYEELQQRHAIFLEPGTDNIQMAWPFSGVETSFKVRANHKIYYANCAWDSLGIPAALQADAVIEAVCAQSGEPIQISITNGQVQKSDALVHFLVPFKDWYNDLPST